ncbi:MAG: hypothetical protein M3P06_03445 [Acidobacteriota bacterium]|nr:hypothetical protein [Acidobacteriota bacterium]
MADMDTPPLQNEIAFFEARRAELLKQAKGRFVLIKNDRVIDVFESSTAAIRRGYEEFGNEPFLVKQVVDVEIPLNFTSFNLGV